MARVLGMHGEEVLARFAAREAQLPFSELDALRYFFYDLSASSFFLSAWLFLCSCVCMSSFWSVFFLPACLPACVSLCLIILHRLAFSPFLVPHAHLLDT
jgi:hypothetical protein